MTSENHRHGHRGSSQTSGRLKAFERFCENCGKINAKDARTRKTSVPDFLDRQPGRRIPASGPAHRDRLPHKLLSYIILTETLLRGSPTAESSPVDQIRSEGEVSQAGRAASKTGTRDRFCQISSNFFHKPGGLTHSRYRERSAALRPASPPFRFP